MNEEMVNKNKGYVVLPLKVKNGSLGVVRVHVSHDFILKYGVDLQSLVERIRD